MKKLSVPAILLLVIAVVLAVVSFINLPEIATTQISLGGSTPARLPKPVAIAIPFLLGAGGAAYALAAGDDDGARSKGFVISVIGNLVLAGILFINCFK